MNQQSKKAWCWGVRGQGFGTRLAVLGLAFFCACAAPAILEPEPEALGSPTGMEASSSQYVGSLLSGPQGGTYKADRLVTCTVEILLLRQALGSALAPLAPLAPDLGLVTQLEGQSPVQGGSRLAVGAGWAVGSEAESAWQGMQSGAWGDHFAFHSKTAIVPMGTTYLMNFAADERVEDPDNFLGEWPERSPVQKSFSVGIHHRSDGSASRMVAGFALRDLVAAEGDEELAQVPREGGRPGADFLIEEWILPAQGSDVQGKAVLWLLPSPFELSGARSIAVMIRTSELDPGKADSTALENCARALEASSEKSKGDSAPETESEARRRQVLRAIQNVKQVRKVFVADETGSGQDLRTALVYLCSLGDLPLGNDLCLTAEPTLLRDWVALVPDPLDREGATSEALAWDLERAAWIQLARAMVKEDLPDVLSALVLRHGGEAGHYPSSLEDAARNSIDVHTFDKRLLQENRLFLEDASPAARVRAFDWLQRRDHAPPDWDPLESKENRTGPLRVWLATFENGENS